MDSLTDNHHWDKYYRNKTAFQRVKKLMNFYTRNELMEIFDKFLPKGKNLCLIEMGCGNSDWLPYFCSEYGYNIAGIDYSKWGCYLAQEKLKKVPCNYEIYCCNFFNWYKKLKKKFDISISFGVIEHFNNPQDIINIFAKYLNKNSIIITVCPNTMGFVMHLQRYIDKRVYDAHKRFNLKDLMVNHELNGFKVIYAGYTGYMDLSNLDFCNYGSVGLLIKIFIKLVNLPIVYAIYIFRRIFKLKTQSDFLSTSMVVAAQRRGP